MKSQFCLLTIILAASAFAAIHENVVFYKDQSNWISSIPAIPAGQPDAGRIFWDGKTPLILKSGKKGYDISRADYLSWMMYLKPGQNNIRYDVILTFADGKKQNLKMTTHKRPGWNRCVPYVGQMKKLPKGTVTAIQFRFAAGKSIPVLLDDIRFASKELDYSYPEDLPPPTSGCFFPEYTTAEIRSRVLNAPDFQKKMVEIERLRNSPVFQFKPAKVHSEAEQKYFDLIQPDGSIKGYSYEDIMARRVQSRGPGTQHESYGGAHVRFLEKLIHAWRWGYCRRTPENREKFFRAVIHAFSAEYNRRGERERFVVASFYFPQIAQNIYRMFYEEMDAVEKGICKDPLTIRLNRILKECSSWAFTHPDWHVQGDFLTVESFRHDGAWVGGNFGYRPVFYSALICRNPGMLDAVSQVASGALSHTSYNTQESAFWKDGLCADGSAWGHGEQNYLFGYPLDGVRGVVKLISQLQGTSWEVKVNGPAIDALLDYMEASLWYGFTCAPEYRRNQKNKLLLQRDIPAACGRMGLKWRSGLAFNDFSKMLNLVNEVRPLLKENTPQRQRLENCYAAMTGNAPLPTGTRYFWNNDLLICRQKSSAAVISMLSKRVRGIESAPVASFLTDFWSDGSAWIMKHPDTYRIARGFFRPCAIPGVTARQWNFTHTDNYWHTHRGLINFAGGAADGDYALCAYRMDREILPYIPSDPKFYDLEARKAYFWFNGELVCLGNGITDRKSMNTPVATTIDQTEWRGPVVFGTDQTRKPGDKFEERTNLLWHDGVGYAILKGQGKASGETRKERWCEFDRSNKKQPNRPKTAPILMLQIAHGSNPKQDSYIYAVHFDLKDFAALQKYAAAPSFRVLANTGDVQAVYHTPSNTLATVFYKAGSVDVPAVVGNREAGGLEVDAPAVVLLRQTPDGIVRVTINDPEQNPKRDSITLGWNGKTYKIKLPAGLYCGQPVTVE